MRTARRVLPLLLLAGCTGHEITATPRDADLPMIRRLDLRAFVSGAAPEDVPLAAGDIAYVPRSRLAEVNLWMDQDVNRIIPFSGNFSSPINRIPTAGGVF